MSKNCAAATTGLALLPFLGSAAWATCSYDLNGVGYGDNCPYRGPAVQFRPPAYYVPPPVVYTPPPPSPEQIRAQQMLLQAHNLNESGVAASRKGQWAAALNAYKQALALSPNDPVIRQNERVAEKALGVATNNAGVPLENSGDLAGAAEDFRRALALDPTDATISGNLARVLSELKDRQQTDAARPGVVAALDAPLAAPVDAPSASSSLDFIAGPAADPLVRVEPPTPGLASLKWSASFPGADAPAATNISQSKFDALAKNARGVREWLGDRLIGSMEGKLKGQAVGRTIESLPISDALKGEAHWQESLIERYKSLYNDIDQDTQDYLFGFMHVTNRAAACIASASTNCDQELLDAEKVSNRYANQSSNRWQAWVKTDVKSRLSHFFNGSDP